MKIKLFEDFSMEDYEVDFNKLLGWFSGEEDLKFKEGDVEKLRNFFSQIWNDENMIDDEKALKVFNFFKNDLKMSNIDYNFKNYLNLLFSGNV
jgi:hypothetical protein